MKTVYMLPVVGTMEDLDRIRTFAKDKGILIGENEPVEVRTFTSNM